MEESSKPAPSKKKKKMIIGSIIAIIIVIVLLIYLLSPAYSPISSIRDTDGDGHPDASDAFPTIASQWSDLDGDGFGDNPAGITPDKFPSDPTQWFDFDHDGYGDNLNGTNPDAFPADPTQWSDLDNDGYGDNPNGTNPDAFPSNSLEWKDTDSDNHGDNSDAYPNNPNYWANGHATINVEIISGHVWFSIAYGVYINGVGSADGYLDPGMSEVKSIQITFPIGVLNQFSVEVKASSTGGGWGTETDIENIVVEPDMTYSVSLVV